MILYQLRLFEHSLLTDTFLGQILFIYFALSCRALHCFDLRLGKGLCTNVAGLERLGLYGHFLQGCTFEESLFANLFDVCVYFLNSKRGRLVIRRPLLLLFRLDLES